MNTTLAIIDVQPEFDAAVEIIDAVVHQISLAKCRNDGIILVEYTGVHKSYNKVYEALGGYDKFSIEHKNTDSGAEQILDAIWARRFSMDRIRLCGVNCCACVQYTAKGLITSGVFSRVELSPDAISCVCRHIDPTMSRITCIENLQTKMINWKVNNV